jgi:large subunit ribosomal protein L14
MTLDVIDNTNVRYIKCLKILKNKYGKINSCFIGVLRNSGKHRLLNKGSMSKALIIRICKNTIKQDGSFYRFKQNSVILIKQTENDSPFGKKIKGPLPLELKTPKYIKSISKQNLIIL